MTAILGIGAAAATALLLIREIGGFKYLDMLLWQRIIRPWLRGEK